MTPAQTKAASVLDNVMVAFAETPPRRRLVRPIRQVVDLKFVRSSDDHRDESAMDPALYDDAGRGTPARTRPGRLLNVRA